MKRIVCMFKGHHWSRPYYNGGNFRQCRRCGATGFEMPT